MCNWWHMVTVVGGKFTTYRQMAADAVDRVCAKLGRRAECSTADLPLLGAAPRDELIEIRLPRRLLYRYGTDARYVADFAREDPSLLEPIAPGVAACGAELLFALRHEGAM